MNDKIDIEAALRASLTEHARQVPAAGVLAERIIARVDLLPPAREPRRTRQWGTWTLPLIAAGSVVAVAAALVGVNQLHHNADHKAPAVPFSSSPTVTATPTATTAPTLSPLPTVPRVLPPVAALGLTGFHADDLTFVGNHGWALGTALCINNPAKTCTAMITTTDNGSTWHSMRGPAATVNANGCPQCVQSVRFATDSVGYVFGPANLFMTVDGGATWTRQSGGALALESLNGNVIRIVPSMASCNPPGCTYTAQTAGIGSSVWHSTGLVAATPTASTGVQLSRTGSRAYLEVFGHVSGGANDARSALFGSADSGATWTGRGEPCPQTGGASGAEVDSIAMTTAPDGSVTVVCRPRNSSGAAFTATSTDAGASFRAGAALHFPGIDMRPPLAAASSTTLLVGLYHSVLRSTDGGRTWVGTGGPSLFDVEWLGFESATDGRATDGRTVWTTHDAGRTWTAHTFR